MIGVLRPHARRVARRLRVEPAYDRGLAFARRLTERPRDLAWRRLVGDVLTNGIVVPTSGSWARPGDPRAQIVVCLWNRPQRLEAVLDMLDGQDWPAGARLMLWNNNPDDRDHYDRVLAERALGDGCLASVDIHHSEDNLGGLARFVVARLARNGGYDGPVIMLDDDQDVSPTFVSDLARDYAPRSVVAWWAFGLHGSYWRRAELPPGAKADHAGTGGTIYDSALVDDDRFFAALPRKYAFLEDQWMTFMARLAGWRVVKADTAISLVLEESNQYHALKPLKDEFYQYQLSRGPRIVGGAGRRTRPWKEGRITGSR